MSLDKLDTAIRCTQQERQSSTAEQLHKGSATEETAMKSSSEASPNNTNDVRPSLTMEASKISHSQSSTESSIPKIADSLSSSLNESASGEDGDHVSKLAMVRKMSGELVRPALRSASRRRRPSSVPGTTYTKNVHFDTQLEHIKHFLQLDQPLAVSANISLVETYSGDSKYQFSLSEGGLNGPAFVWKLRLANFPKDTTSREHLPVRLERIFLSSDTKNLVGVVVVANLAFHKQVVARFTFDYWKTISEVSAEYHLDVRREHANDGYDRFNFTIKLLDRKNLGAKTMFICIRYIVSGQEFWDNNASMNYQVDFTQKEKSNTTEKHNVPSSNSRHMQPLPRSYVLLTSAGAPPRSMPPSFDDPGSDIDANFPAFSQDSRISEPPLRLTLADSDDMHLETPRRREKLAQQAFGNRYDFGVSLSAEIQSKNTILDYTTLSAEAKSESQLRSGCKILNSDRVVQNLHCALKQTK